MTWASFQKLKSSLSWTSNGVDGLQAMVTLFARNTQTWNDGRLADIVPGLLCAQALVHAALLSWEPLAGTRPES